MADIFIDQITAELQAMSDANGFGWTAVAQASPARKEWNTLPMVIVAPDNKSPVVWHAFGHKNVVSSYSAYLVSTNEMVNVPSNIHDLFVRGCIGQFMPPSDAMRNGGAWEIRVEPQTDYDRTAFPKQYIVSLVSISVSWIFA